MSPTLLAGATLGSAAIGGAAQIFGGLKANKASAKEAAKSREFTTKMMKRRHQWEVADLRAAGLNPIMSAGGTPSMGSSAMATQQNVAAGASDAVSSGISSALATRRLKQELDNMTAVEEKTYQDKKTSSELQKKYEAEKLEAATRATILHNQLPQHRRDHELYSGEHGLKLRAAERLAPVAGHSAKALGDFLSLGRPNKRKGKSKNWWKGK